MEYPRKKVEGMNFLTFFHFINFIFFESFNYLSRHGDVDSLYKKFKWVTRYLNEFRGENLCQQKFKLSAAFDLANIV